MFLFILGILLIISAASLSFFFRLRMTKLGNKLAILQAGSFDFAEYHKVRQENGWAAWPVYLMWFLMICGIALAIGGFFLHFGTSPKHA